MYIESDKRKFRIKYNSNIKRNMVKNELKQNLINYTEHRSSNKSAGDCL